MLLFNLAKTNFEFFLVLHHAYSFALEVIGWNKVIHTYSFLFTATWELAAIIAGSNTCFWCGGGIDPSFFLKSETGEKPHFPWRFYSGVLQTPFHILNICAYSASMQRANVICMAMKNELSLIRRTRCCQTESITNTFWALLRTTESLLKWLPEGLVTWVDEGKSLCLLKYFYIDFSSPTWSILC